MKPMISMSNVSDGGVKKPATRVSNFCGRGVKCYAAWVSNSSDISDSLIIRVEISVLVACDATFLITQ